MAAGLAMAIAGTISSRAAEPSAAGLWQKVENGKPVVWVLVVDHHDGTFEGVLAKLFPKPGDEAHEFCAKCTDDRKNAPWLGLSFIRDMKRNGLNYENGNVLDPRDGKVYKATMKLSEDGQTLVVRGYVGFELLGENQYWTRLPDSAFSMLDPSINPNTPANPAPPPNQKRSPSPPAHKSELPPASGGATRL